MTLTLQDVLAEGQRRLVQEQKTREQLSDAQAQQDRVARTIALLNLLRANLGLEVPEWQVTPLGVHGHGPIVWLSGYGFYVRRVAASHSLQYARRVFLGSGESAYLLEFLGRCANGHVVGGDGQVFPADSPEQLVESIERFEQAARACAHCHDAQSHTQMLATLRNRVRHDYPDYASLMSALIRMAWRLPERELARWLEQERQPDDADEAVVRPV